MAYTIFPAPGSISITHTSANITGVGTNFTAYRKGTLILVPGFGIIGQLAADPPDDLHATLVAPLGGTVDIAAAAYQAIAQSEPAVYSERVRQMLETGSTIPVLQLAALELIANKLLATDGTGNLELIDLVAGVPAGGTAGQVLAKASSADDDTAWIDQAGNEALFASFPGSL